MIKILSITILSVLFIFDGLYFNESWANDRSLDTLSNGVVGPEIDRNIIHVLIIGDSIAAAYVPHVISLVGNCLSIKYIDENAGSTKNGLHKINKWLNNQNWDLVHFNWGLHDLKYTKKTDKGIQRHVSPMEYMANLKKLVDIISRHTKKMIFATTTPVPEGEPIRVVSDVHLYNKIAVRIMGDAGIDINDLYSYTMQQGKGMMIPKNVHFNTKGAKLLGEKVADDILNTLGVECEK
jgi:acyl-CoA thioesterase-1